MKKRSAFILLIVTAWVLVFSTPLLARDLAVENYKLAVKSLEAKEWEEAKHYLDEVILDDLSQSEFFAKSVYLKTVLLAAETKQNIKLANHFAGGEEKIPIENDELQNKFELKVKNYRRNAKQNVDTLIGLANYLVANLPPLQINLDYLYRNASYDQNLINSIESGTMVSEDKLAELEEDLLKKNVNHYLQLTLSVRKFNNLGVIRARKGDNLYSLAQAYNIPFYLMLSANSHIEDPNKIYPGEKIYIPQVSSSYVSYPPYFYYLSRLAYETNPQRKQDIMRLVEKAYQLTNSGDITSRDYVRKESKELDGKLEVESYQQRLEDQEEKISNQQEQLKELKNKYNQLLTKLEEIVSDSEEKSETSNPEDYEPEKDPLTY